MKKNTFQKTTFQLSAATIFNNMNFQFNSEKDSNIQYYFKYQWDVGFQKSLHSIATLPHSIATVVCIHL